MIAFICAAAATAQLGEKIVAAVGVRSLTAGLLVIREIEDLRGFRGIAVGLGFQRNADNARE